MITSICLFMHIFPSVLLKFQNTSLLPQAEHWKTALLRWKEYSLDLAKYNEERTNNDSYVVGNGPPPKSDQDYENIFNNMVIPGEEG